MKKLNGICGETVKILDTKKTGTVIPGKREINEMSPKVTVAFCLEVHYQTAERGRRQETVGVCRCRRLWGRTPETRKLHRKTAQSLVNSEICNTKT